VGAAGDPDAEGDRRRPIDVAWACLPVLLPAIAALVTRMRAIDLAYHVRLGQQILDTYAIPRFDTFTFSANGHPWVDQQWLAQALVGSVFRLGGWAGLAVARAALTSVGFLFLYLACRRAGAAARSASVLSIAAFVVAAPFLAMRPQLFVLPLFAATMWALAGRIGRPRRVWLVPVAACVAANVHGSFPIFVVAAVLAAVEDKVRRRGQERQMAVVATATLLATLLNPFGVEVWRYVWDISTSSTIRDTVTEWAPLSIRDPAGALTFGSMLATFAYLALRRRPVPWTSLLWLGAFLVPAFVTQRAILWWCFVAPVIVGRLLAEGTEASRARSSRGPASRVPAYGMVGGLVVVLVILLPWWRHPTVFDLLSDAPPGATAAVMRLPAGSRLFAHQPWGSWFEFATPQDPVFVDSRIELFPDDVWETYGQVVFARSNWRDALAGSGADVIVADPREWDLLPTLKTDPAWRVIYDGSDGIVLVRR
jgi:hypothetical protein